MVPKQMGQLALFALPRAMTYEVPSFCENAPPLIGPFGPFWARAWPQWTGLGVHVPIKVHLRPDEAHRQKNVHPEKEGEYIGSDVLCSK